MTVLRFECRTSNLNTGSAVEWGTFSSSNRNEIQVIKYKKVRYALSKPAVKLYYFFFFKKKKRIAHTSSMDIVTLKLFGKVPPSSRVV